MNSDTAFESDETVGITFSGTGLAANVTATGTITNDDVGPDRIESAFTLTGNADTGAAFVGTSVSNVYNATLATLTAGDSLDGADGDDTLVVTANITANTNTAGFTASNIEAMTVNVSDGDTATAETATLNMLSVDSVSSINVSGATTTTLADTAAFTNVQTNAAINISNNTNVNTNVSYAATVVAGTDDTAVIALSNSTSTATTDGIITLNNGFESVSLASNGTVNNQVGALNSGTATTLTITGANPLQILTALSAPVLTVAGGDSTGNIVLISDAAAGNAVSITTGSGIDNITLTGTNAAVDTVSTGDGNDFITFTATLGNTYIINGGDGTDILAGDDGELAGLTAAANNVTSIEVIQVNTPLATPLNTANTGGQSIVTLAGAASASTLTMPAGAATVFLAATLNGITIADTGAATDD